MSETTRADQVRHLAERLAALLNDCGDAAIGLVQNRDDDSGELIDMFTVIADGAGWEGVQTVELDDVEEKWMVSK